MEDIARQGDAEIARSVQDGEPQAYRELVVRYHASLVRYATRLLGSATDAEDVIQEVFLHAYERIRQYDPDRSFSSWVYRIAHNECVDALKRKRREPVPFFDPDVLFPHPVSRETPDDHVMREEMLDLIERYLSRLDWKYREPLVLHYISERSYEEISDILHIPVATVGVRLSRARNRLRALRAAHP